MECGLCGTLNRDLARFCGGCGAPLGRVCPTCKSEIDAGLRFCDQCGTEVNATPAAPAAAPNSEAVRKTVTVLFADLGGSTGFGERTDPEIARQVLARYHAMLQQAVDAHGGTVAKFMGDGMMATFGVPEVAEDDAERAVRAGIEIQDRFARFAADIAARYGETLTARVGINTGEIVIGAADADLVGDALNVAARLEKACRPGHVLVGEETWRVTRGVLAYEPLGEVTVAGREQPVGTYEVSAVERRAAEPVAPFVGRDGELERLRVAFDRAVSDRSAVLVTVLGSPGLGKTRLSREFLAGLTAMDAAATFEIRCDRAGTATFAPVADLVRVAAGLGESETEEGARQRLRTLLDGIEDVDRVVDGLVGVLGVAPQRSVEETFWSVRRGVEALAAAHPLVIVIDDIQWAEPKLLDLAEHLQEWVSDAPVLLVGLARPELRELRPTFVERGRRVADVLSLDGLDARATEELAARLLGGALPQELVARLPVSTDGNPLFVRELVRMLVDDRVIVRRDDREWELAIDAEAIEVPPTIQSLLATRVERLPADELRVLECAAVVGVEFSVGALRELVGGGPDIPTLLERMRRRELVEPTGSYWGDDPVHRFHHVLIRDAAYRRLLKGARAELHQRVGEWTGAAAVGAAGEHDITVAFHYEQARRYRTELGNDDDETERLGARAAELFAAAAHRALEGDDLTAAGALARRALAVLPGADREARAGLLLTACESLLASGDVVGGRPLVDELTRSTGADPQLAAWADCFRAQLVGLTEPEGLVEAEALAAQAAMTFDALGDGAGEAKAHQVRALLLARLGRVGEAEAVLDLALGAARAADDRRRVTAVLGAAPQAALFGPSPVARAGGRCLDVVRLLRITTASPSVEATSMRCQAVLEALRGRFDVSRSMLASSRTALEELGLRHGLLETDLFAGMVELIAGEPAEAVAPLRAAYEGLGTLGVGADAGQAAALLATALLAQGEVDEAELMAAESQALSGQNLKTAIAWRTAKAAVLAARGDLDGAVALAEDAVEIAAGTDLVLDHADACVVLADLREATGDHAGARSALDEAHRLYEAKGATVPAERIQAPGPTIVDAAGPARPLRQPDLVHRSGAAGAPTGNTATRVHAQICDAINRRDLSAQRRLTADDWALDDRRPLLRYPAMGAPEMSSTHEVMLTQGYELLPPQPIAFRGELLALSRIRGRTQGGDETVNVVLNELDETGRIARTVLFGDDDLDQALTALHDRFLAGEGAGFDLVLEASDRMGRLQRARDWDGLRAQFSDELVFVDRRRLGFDGTDADGLIALLRSGVELAEDLLSVARSISLADRTWLSVLDTAGSDANGAQAQWVRHVVTHLDGSGRIDRIEWFAEGEFDAALARFRELDALSDERSAAIENGASREAQRFARLLQAGRLEEAAATISPEIVQRDLRTLVAAPESEGPGGYEAALAAAIGVGVEVLDYTTIAVRGDRLCLGRRSERTAAGFETVCLVVTEMDEHRRCVYSAIYDETDLLRAVDDLSERHLAGEGAADAPVVIAGQTMNRLVREQDWDAFRDLLGDGFRLVDHRPMGFGSGGVDEFLSILRSGMELSPDLVQVPHKVLVSGPVGLTVLTGSGHDDAGGAVEWARYAVSTVDAQGRVGLVEWFADDDWDAALARFDVLSAVAPTWDGPTPPASAVVTNRATEMLRTGYAGLSADPAKARGLTAEGIGTAGGISPEIQREDRRRLVASPFAADGREFLDEVGALFELFDRIELEPVAVRGERLTLVRVRCRREPDFESSWLSLYEFDEQDRVAREIAFDDRDLDTAASVLDERYLSGEGASHAEVVRAARAALSDDALVRKVYVEGRAVLMVWTDGARDAAPRVDVVRVDADGAMVDHRTFGLESFDTAYARLGQRGDAVLRSELVANAATIWVLHGVAMVNASPGSLRDLVSAEAAIAEVTREDRRRMISMPTVTGRVDWQRHLESAYEMYDWLEAEPVAVRGDRLALVRLRGVRRPDFESWMLNLYELDEHGRLVVEIDFDDDALDAAMAELDARYLAGEGAPHVEVLRAARRLDRAGDDRDALAGLIAPGFEGADHRRLAFGTGDRDTFLGIVRSNADAGLTPIRTLNRRVEVVGRAVLAVRTEVRRTATGAEYEWSGCDVLLLDADGRALRIESFDLEEFDAASARLRELGSPTVSGPVLENAATRLEDRTAPLVAARRWEELRSWIAPGVVDTDHRSGVGVGTIATGPDEMIANLRIAESRSPAVERMVEAIRGDRLALVRLVYRVEGYEIRMLHVVGVDEHGRCDSVDTYDEDDLASALRELDRRYFLGEGSVHRRVLEVCARFMAATRNYETDRVMALLAPDFEFVDRRPLGLAGGDAAYFAEVGQARADVSPAGVDLNRVIEIVGSTVLVVQESQRVTAEGSDYVVCFNGILEVDDSDRIRRIEWFPEDRYHEAVARLQELGDPSLSAAVLDNGAARVSARMVAALDDILRTGVIPDRPTFSYAPGFGAADRRSIVAMPGLGVDDILEVVRVMRAQGYREASETSIAVRGDRLSLTRRRVRTPAGDETASLALLEIDEDERVAAFTLFDDDDLAAAVDELDERYAAGEGAGHQFAIRRTADLRHAMAAHDWAAVEALVGDDFVFADHRPIGLPGAGRAGYVTAMRAAAEQTPNAVLVARSVEIRGDVTLLHTKRAGPTHEGFEYDWEQLAVSRWAAGRLQRVELFTLDDEASARARFEELAASEVRPDVDNAAVRAITRAYWLRRFVGPEAAGPLVSREITGEDRRRTVSMPGFHGRAGFAQAMDATDAVFSDGADIVPIAVRGDRLALVRDRLRHGDDELEVLNLWEIDEAGRLGRATLFDSEDLSGAVAAMNARYAEIRTEPAGVYEQWFSDRPVAAIDWEEARHRGAAPDALMTDHRTLGFPDASMDDYLERVGTMVASVPDAFQLTTRQYLRPGAELIAVDMGGTSVDGAAVMWHVVVVVRVRGDGRMDRGAYFAPEQWDEAVALFEEWSGGGDLPHDVRSPDPDNAAVRALLRLGALAWTDLDAAVELFAPDAEGVTRQTGPMAGASAFGRPGWRNVLASFVDTYDAVRVEPLAARDEHLALMRYEFVAGGFESGALLVVDVDDDGLIQRIETFDDDDLADAVESLEGRYRVRVGAAYPRPAAQMADAERQLNRGTAGDFARVLAQGFTITDRQHFGAWTCMSRDDYLASLRVFVEQTPARTFFFPKWYVAGNFAIAVTRSIGLTPEGSRYEWSNVQVLEVDASALAVRVELFPEGAWAAALERFDEWSSTHDRPRGEELVNLATRSIAAFVPRLTASDVGGARSFLAEDYEYTDHRFSGIAPDASGPGQFFANMAGYESIGVREVDQQILAIRGEHLVLRRQILASREGFEIVELRVAQVDADGRFVHTDVYDESDLVSAVAELNARYRASGEATDAELRALDAIDAMNRRDWDVMVALLDADLVAVDHQPLGFAPTDRDGFVAEWMGGLVEQMPDAATVVAEVRGRGPAVFGRLVTHGTTVDGNEYGWDSLFVARLGTGARIEFFPTDRRAEALALMEALGDPGVAVTEALGNRAWRQARAFARHVSAGDLDVARSLLAPDHFASDRRRGVAAPDMVGPDARIANLAAVIDVFGSVGGEAVALRGEDLVLYRWTISQEKGFATSGYDVAELDGTGRLAQVVTFDDDDLGGALEELDERYAARQPSEVEIQVLAACAALDRRDWEALRTFMADDLVVVDRRTLGFPEGRGASSLISELQRLVARVPDVGAYVTRVESRGDLALVVTRQSGSSTVDGPAQWGFLTVVRLGARSRRIERIDSFDAEDVDRARELFDAGDASAVDTADPSPHARLGDGVTEAFARRDWDWIRSQISDDIELRDLRSTVSSQIAAGADAVIELLRGFADVGFVSMHNELVDARGPRLALFRRVYRTEAGFELVMLAAAERDDQGHIAAMTLFDADDLDAARAELDTRARSSGTSA